MTKYHKKNLIEVKREFDDTEIYTEIAIVSFLLKKKHRHYTSRHERYHTQTLLLFIRVIRY